MQTWALLQIAYAITNSKQKRHGHETDTPQRTVQPAQPTIQNRVESFQSLLQNPPRPAGGFGSNCNLDRRKQTPDNKGQPTEDNTN